MAMTAPLSELLERSAARFPDQPVVQDPTRETQVTYGELDRWAAETGGTLAELGIRPGERVGVCASKSASSVAAIFSILKAGGAYVPVDPGSPAARSAFIFRDCSVRAVIVERALADDLRAESGDLFLPAARTLGPLAPHDPELLLLESPARAPAATDIPDLAYILYTSGSTGRPKGVMHTHGSALAFIDWCSSVFLPTAEDRFSSHAPFHFDLSILDIYVPIKHGARIVLLGEGLGKRPDLLAKVIAESRLTAWYSTPTILRLLVENGRMEDHDYSSLRIVNFAGEVFPIKQLRALQERWPHPRYFNLYGPTETNVCTYHEVTGRIDAQADSLPIGVACSGDRTMVVDEENRPLPAGETGELLVSGGSVMRGYWNLPDQNDKAFHIDGSGVRWYRTGDVVRDEGGGSYAFLGRRDRMVKRRGYRVELGEIESTLYRHPSVREAAVLARTDEEGGVSIHAFVSWADDGKPSLVAIKRFCAENLPLYMVPDRFSFPGELPKTSTSKIDYQKLRVMD